MGQFSREQTRILNLLILYITDYDYTSISMHPLPQIKTQGKHFYTETIYERIKHEHAFEIFNSRYKI
jgi:hypothetical protein